MTGRRWLFLMLTAVVTLVTTVRGSAQERMPPPSVAFTNVTLIDGIGGPARPAMTVLVVGDRVQDVFPSGGRELEPGTRVHDLAGRFIVPGLINSHVHFRQLSSDDPRQRYFDRELSLVELERSLYGGITMVRDMGGAGEGASELARLALEGDRPLPEVHFVEIVAGPGFFANDARVERGADGSLPPRPRGMVTDASDVSEMIGAASTAGASAIKIFSDLDADLVHRIAAEARRQGMRAWAHAAVYPTRPGEVVRAGVDGIVHTCGIPWEVLPSVPGSTQEARRTRFDPADVDPDDARFRALFDEMARLGTMLEPTLYIYTSPATQARGCAPGLMDALAGAAHRAGVPIVTGTDFFTAPSDPFPSLHLEIEYLVEHGILTPLEAITAATLNSARAIGVEGSHGSIEPGKVADMVILTHDPTLDISALRSVEAVVKRGRLYRRNEYEEERGAGR